MKDQFYSNHGDLTLDQKQQPQYTLYTILWYDDGGSCWCNHCVYTEGTAFNSSDEAERYAEEKVNTVDYALSYKIQKVALSHNLGEKVSQ